MEINMSKFITLHRDTEVKDILAENPSYTSIILLKSVQAGKTSDVLKLADVFYKTSSLIFISDKNTALAGQTNNRAKVIGFDITNYRDGVSLAKALRGGFGHKKILHMLMEVNNLQKLIQLLEVLDELPVTIIIDEADKSRNTEAANKKKFDENDEEELEVADGCMLPPVTMMLLQIKNLVKGRKDSRTIFVSATPAGILMSEKDSWLLLYKQPYQNYVGVGINHPANIHIQRCIPENHCKARERWTNSKEDKEKNTFYGPVTYAVDQFTKAINRSENESITQIMLISLENRKCQQFQMAKFISDHLKEMNVSDVAIEVFNSDTKEDSETTLTDIIKQSGKKKVIIIAGFLASRGISFTDFSDKDNQFELIIQVHYTKKTFPLNSSLQAMRISGPARRTVSKPALLCNIWAEQDILINFAESYRIIQELAENDCATQGNYNSMRPVSQPYNFRYLKQGYRSGPGEFIFVSSNIADHLPIVP